MLIIGQQNFCKYVKDNDREGFVLLSRDHGGPWQNYSEVENKLEFQDALVSSKVSFCYRYRMWI